MLTLGDGQSVTLIGTQASLLTADNFAFDQTPVIHNAATMTVGDGAMLPLSGIIDNSDSIALGSEGNTTLLQLIQHGISLQGGGTVVLFDNAQNVVSGTLSDVTLTNVDNTISGAGQIGAGSLTLVNQGTIVADGTNAMTIDTGDNEIENSGTLATSGSGGLIVDGALDNDGFLFANGGEIVVNGAVHGSGSSAITGGATMEFKAAADIAIDLGQGDGVLKLGDSFHFTGTISQFGAGDAVDLADFRFSDDLAMIYAANDQGTGGQLTVSDGTHIAALTLQGQYTAAGFAAGQDAQGGVVLWYHHGNDALV